MKQSEALDMITKIQLAHQAMESACKRIDELKEENKNLKEALAKQEQGEPVALQMDVIVVNLVREGINKHRARELAQHFINHTTPQQRKPLTDEQIYDMYNEPRSDAEMLEFARAIEAAHGIKE